MNTKSNTCELLGLLRKMLNYIGNLKKYFMRIHNQKIFEYEFFWIIS